MNGYGKLRRMTGRNAKIIEFYLYLAAAFGTAGLTHSGRHHWDTRPTTKRLKTRPLPRGVPMLAGPAAEIG